MKKLDKNELETVTSFIKKRGFRYLDVESELLDHVACRVEELMEENPETTLDSAIQKTHTEFGVFGFSAIDDAIKAGLTKKYNRLFWKTFLSFLGPKYILLVLFGTFCMYRFQVLMNNYASMYLTLLAALLPAVFCLFKLHRLEYKRYLAYRLATGYFTRLGSFLYLTLLVIHEATEVDGLGFHTSVIIFSFLMGCFVLYFISAIKTANAGIMESQELRDKYQVS
jgi:hypothetical protein